MKRLAAHRGFHTLLPDRIGAMAGRARGGQHRNTGKLRKRAHGKDSDGIDILGGIYVAVLVLFMLLFLV